TQERRILAFNYQIPQLPNYKIFTSVQPQAPSPPSSQSPAATETSIQRPSVGHIENVATCHAPRCKQKEIRTPARQTRTAAAAVAASLDQTLVRAIRPETATTPGTQQ